jgi:predicted hotdog family 3-hydroxylacyl-ACP dehydratase
MPAPAPTPEHPDDALIAYEAELEALVIEWNALAVAAKAGLAARQDGEGIRLGGGVVPEVAVQLPLNVSSA